MFFQWAWLKQKSKRLTHASLNILLDFRVFFELNFVIFTYL